MLSALKPPVYANPRYVAACVSAVIRLLLRIDPTSPMAPKSLVPLGLAGFTLPLCTNVLVTGLIAGRIWYLSPRKAHHLPGGNLPVGRGRATIDIIVESGAIYLAVQLILVILFAIGHPAQAIVTLVAVQIYVGSLSHNIRTMNFISTLSITGHCANTDCYPCRSRAVEYALQWAYPWIILATFEYANTRANRLQYGIVRGL